MANEQMFLYYGWLWKKLLQKIKIQHQGSTQGNGFRRVPWFGDRLAERLFVSPNQQERREIPMSTLICSGGARRSTIIAIQKPLYIEEIRKFKMTQNTENK